MADLGFDFLVLDMQHCELTQAQFPGILGAFREGGPTPVVRAPKNDYHIINWLFDQGVGAVLVPMVNSVEDARRAVEAAKFPPLGCRSFGPYRAANYASNTQPYMAEADARAALIVQVESVSGAQEIDSILKVPGIDAVFLGPNDLAFSMLKSGQSLLKPSDGPGTAGGINQWTAFARTPEVLALCEEILNKAKAASIPLGMTSGSIEEARAWLSKGASLTTFGSDFLFIRAGARHLCGMLKSKSATAAK
jgi:4-hydroxy-2-oxoheptanedioate aldolase